MEILEQFQSLRKLSVAIPGAARASVEDPNIAANRIPWLHGSLREQALMASSSQRAIPTLTNCWLRGNESPSLNGQP